MSRHWLILYYIVHLSVWPKATVWLFSRTKVVINNIFCYAIQKAAVTYRYIPYII